MGVLVMIRVKNKTLIEKEHYCLFQHAWLTVIPSLIIFPVSDDEETIFSKISGFQIDWLHWDFNIDFESSDID